MYSTHTYKHTNAQTHANKRVIVNNKYYLRSAELEVAHTLRNSGVKVQTVRNTTTKK